MYVQRSVPGILYERSDGGGRGGRGLGPEGRFIRLRAGFAGMLAEKACGMRAVRQRRKESVGDIVGGYSNRAEHCRQANAGTEKLGEKKGCEWMHVQREGGREGERIM